MRDLTVFQYEPRTSPATAIARAVTAIRQNRAIIVEDAVDRSRAALVLPAEGLTEDGLRRAWRLGAEPPRLTLSGRRAASLGRPSDHDPVAVRLQLDPSMSAAGLDGIIDPQADQDVPAALLDRIRPAAATDVDGVAVALMKAAELLPAAIVVPLANEGLQRTQELDGVERFALRLADVLGYHDHLARNLVLTAEARVPLFDCEDARLVTFRPATGGAEHVAIVLGRPALDRPVLTRLHSSCLTGDILGSLRCDCGEQLRGAIRAIRDAGGGVLLYLSQEGRSIGLVNKLRAYGLQDRGLDTVDANEHLGFESDERNFRVAAEMLRQLGVKAVRLMTNNPEKITALQRYGVPIQERVPHAFPANMHNFAYLQTKAARSGHYLPIAAGLAAAGEPEAAPDARAAKVAALRAASGGDPHLERGAQA